MWKLILFCLFVVHQTSGVMYRITPWEYDRMPPLSQLDAFAPCMRRRGDAYCFVTAQLHGNLSDPLYNLILEYSASTLTHFDHSQLHWGICPKKRCGAHMNSSSNLTEVIEACLNETLAREYKLTSKVVSAQCQEYHEDWQLEASDYAFAALVGALLALNVLGSLYDFYCTHGRSTFGGKLLLCFSVRGNWRRLAAPASSEKMLRRTRVLFSVKTITAFLVIMAHSCVAALLGSSRPLFIEETYHHLFYQVLYNGTQIVQTFFIMSGFLLAYNTLVAEQRRPTRWRNLPRGVLLRWLRLTPPYALVTFYTMTWARRLGAGPLYQKVVLEESIDCWQDWWRHLLYIHNYKDYSQCMAHAWYLAADFQLSVVGMVIFCLLSSNPARKLAIGAVVLVGLLTPAVHTFVQDLNAVLIVSPQVVVNFFVHDPTFNNIYKRGHTNLVCYGLGLAMAYSVFNLKESDLGTERFKKYRVLYWLLFPLMLVTVLVGSVFYVDGIVVPLAVRVVYSSAVKIIFGFLNILFIFFTITKVDRAFRGFLHWGGWARAARLSYLAYLVHMPLVRFARGNSDTLIPFGNYWAVQNVIATISMSFALAVPLYVTLEAPCTELVKLCVAPAPRAENTKHVSTVGPDILASKETIEMKI